MVTALVEAYPETVHERHPHEGFTPLHYVEKVAVETVQFLLERCLQAVRDKDIYGKLPLHWAAEGASLESVRILVRAFLDAVHVEDEAGFVPRQRAIEFKSPAEVAGMLDGTASVEALLPDPGWYS